MKKRNAIIGKLFMTLGSLLILSGLFILCHNYLQENTAANKSNSVLLELQQQMELNHDVSANSQYSDHVIELDKTEYLGILSIPALDLQLPVQADWSYPKLRSTPCVYSGSIQNGGLVILAHNYRRHFGLIKNLHQGDEILLTDLTGNKYHYEVEELLVLDATSVDEMVDGSYDLSLFTCTYGGKARVTVRCTLQNELDRYPIVHWQENSSVDDAQIT